MADDDPHEKRVIRDLRGETASAADAAAEYEGREERNRKDRERENRNRGSR